MSETLEPCPLCGSDNVWVYFDDQYIEYPLCHAGCRNCGISIEEYTEEEAIKTWNTLKHKRKEAAKWFNAETSVTPSIDADADFWRLCEEHLKHAREEHPGFAKVVSQLHRDQHRGYLEHFRETQTFDLEDAPSVYNILREEVEEFILEMLRCDKARAREEGADIVAVVRRALDGDHLKEVQE